MCDPKCSQHRKRHEVAEKYWGKFGERSKEIGGSRIRELVWNPYIENEDRQHDCKYPVRKILESCFVHTSIMQPKSNLR